MRGLQILGGADRHPVIRVIGRIERRDERHAGKPVGTVLVVLPPLVEDDVALILELGFGERGEEVTHAIGFHPQRQLHGVGRHHLPVVRPVGVGRSVEQATDLLQGSKIPGVVVLRSLEHQVLEQVRESRAPRLLVLRADVVPHVDRDNRTIVIFVHDHVEAVVEPLMDEWDVHYDSRINHGWSRKARERIPVG